MANQLNFPDELPQKLINVRPNRLSSVDTNQFQIGTRQVVFGETSNDVVEIWVYDAAGVIAGHVTLPVTDDALKLSTVMDNTGAYEFLNIDFGKVVRDMELEQGRYAVAVNVFRNEIGSESAGKLIVETISDDRTELRLVAKDNTSEQLRQIYEFIVPSVPKIAAQALIDQTFGRSLDAQVSETLDPQKVISDLNLLIGDASSRISYASVDNQYNSMVNQVLSAAYTRALNKMAIDTQNLNIQEPDLLGYIRDAVRESVAELKSAGIIDKRFEVS